jgi:hypothetical protein
MDSRSESITERKQQNTLLCGHFLTCYFIISCGAEIYLNYTFNVSRNSSVGIATSYWLDDRGVGVRVPVGSIIFSTSSRPALGSTQPPIQWVPGALSPGVERPGREAHQSPPASAEVNNMRIYTSTPPYAFMA